MYLFALNIFISAFLLFQIQPMIGKVILPWFGGAPTVWTTAMLFFQIMLTGGYAYAYWLAQRVEPGRQKTLHLSLTAVAIMILMLLAILWKSPITPDAAWKPQEVDSPIFDIFKLLQERNDWDL